MSKPFQPAPQRRHRVLTLSLLSACLLPVLASADVLTLPTVVISATGDPQPYADALPAVSVIDRDDIEQSGATSLVTLLQQQTGVQLTQSGGPGQPANVFVRGFSGPDVLVLIDGVPLNAEDSTGIAYLNNLGTAQVERVEIIRGNVSALYGSGAIGGAVLVTTRAIRGEPQTSVTVQAGSRNTASLSAQTSGSAGNVQLQAGFSRDTTAGFSAINPTQAPNANPNANDFHNTSVSAGLEQDVAPGQSWGLRAFTSRGRVSFDSAFGAPTDTYLAETTQDLYQLFSHNKLSADWNSEVTLSRQQTHYDYLAISSIPFTSDNSPARTVIDQALWRNTLQLGAGWSLSAGADVQKQSLDFNDPGAATGQIDQQRDARAVFAGVNGKLGANQLQANWRLDSVSGFSPRNTGYVGWGHELGGGFKALASYSTAFNVPPLGYLSIPAYGANPNLLPESAHTVEAGLQWSAAGQLLSARLFRTRASDQWLWVADPANVIAGGEFENVASAQDQGLELSARGSWQGWGLDANLTLQQPLNLSLPGDPTLQRQARSLANLAVQHAWSGVVFGAALHYTGPRWDKDLNSNPVTLGAYSTLDLNASAPINAQWSWNARIENLFDKQYQQAWSYNRVPFGVFAGVTWRGL